MALFTAEELATYAQRSLSRATAELLAELVEDAILGHPELGARVTTPPQRGIKGLALEMAKRAITNPANVQTESANGTAVTLFPSGSYGVDLTDRELAKLRAIVGDSTAYTVDLQDHGLGERIDWPPRVVGGWP